MPVTRHTSPVADSRNSANLRKYGSDVQWAQLARGTGVPILLSPLFRSFVFTKGGSPFADISGVES